MASIILNLAPVRPTPEFPNYLDPIARNKSGSIEVFRDFVRMSACALAAQTREPEYLEVAGRYTRKDLDEICKAFGSLMAQMEAEPFADLLGSHYQDINSKATRDGRGEFFTPPEISELMAKIAFNAEKVIAEGKPVSVSEPTCGSGGMLLQIAKQLAPKEEGAPSHVDLMRVTAVDIAPTSCDMAYINLTAWGIPSEIIHGNSLSMETWSHWKNVHWHRVGEDDRRRLQRMKEFVTSKDTGDLLPSEKKSLEKASELVAPAPSIIIPRRESGSGQFEFDLE